MSVFRFKQFAVDQTGCAMKVNTDGVLLGALAEGESVKRILDIGAGTGVIALMLAQRFPEAIVDAVEIDKQAAETSAKNFNSSSFANRLNLIEGDFADINGGQYDLIVSNPPFFIDSLTSAQENKTLARHTDGSFFERLVSFAKDNLSDKGNCQLILPLATTELVKQLLTANALHLQAIIHIKSFKQDTPHREIITFGKVQVPLHETEVVIYDAPKVYSAKYAALLKDFLTIF
ncbi:methyltransferase domain-containing protein [Mucilaginibacter conchicola]|uniref:tRNA1(Val) (adenine(37)-N6)-methyltransferase n=1 Tax=Mucilaginibacter conchicola TaxID=2303333 RepID=A0A372NW90_9SPHI|nr:methyltransferase [Mucilaginibacter conchicola]RFZ94393.1 methyltransferase domain-containing protein [Mucilaginibacter conchicola]